MGSKVIMGGNYQSDEPVEPYLLQKRNYCFILSNIEFAGHMPLVGYNFDVENIRKTFEGLNFIVEHQENKKAMEMIQIFTEWANDTDFSNTDCVVSFILSHGDEHGVIYGTDSNPIHIHEVQSIWNSDELSGKPKLVFLQACRGEMNPVAIEEEFVQAGPVLKENSKFRDSFVYYSTTEGFASFVSKLTGTPFIWKICSALKQYGGTHSLSKLVTMINKSVSENVVTLQNGTQISQASEAAFTLHTDFFFGHYQEENIDGDPKENTDADSNDFILNERHIKKRNHCIILTNTECKTHKSQCQTFKQSKGKIEKTFSYLNFDIEIKDNLKGNGLDSKFKELKRKDYTDSDCFACVVLSCGGMSGDLGVIYGSDGKHYSIDVMISSINNNKKLHNKPKLFFVVLNRCNQNIFRVEEEYTPAGGGGRAKCAETFIYYVLVDNENDCASFITKLCNILNEFARQGRHLGEMVLKVNELCAMESARFIPEACHTLTQEVYFQYAGAGCQENSGGSMSEEGTDIGESMYAVPGQQRIIDTVFTPAQFERSFSVSKSPPVEHDDDGDEIAKESGMKSPPMIHDQHPIGGSMSDVIQKGSLDEKTVTTSVIEVKYPQEEKVLCAEPPTPAEPTVERLTYTQLSRLKAFLDDPNSVAANWLHLGKAIFAGNRELINKVDHLKREVFGGGSPGDALINNLRTDPDFTVGKFVDVTKMLKRKDILKLFCNIPLGTPFDELDALLCDKIALCLDKDVKGIKKWRDFAYALDFDDEQVKEFQNTRQHSGSSPTEALIELIKTNNPHYTLSSVKSNCQVIGRNDVANYIDELIGNLSIA